MSLKYYRLTDKADPFLDANSVLTFRMRVSKLDENGKKVRLGKNHCPLIKVKKGEIVKTVDDYAQKMIENYIVPQNFAITFGKPFPEGYMFEEVDAQPVSASNDLDAHFAKIKLPKRNRS